MITTLIGIFGAAIILIFFILNESHKISADSFSYDLWNLIGSILLCIYAYLLSSWPFLILNLVWAAFSLKDVIRDIKKK